MVAKRKSVEAGVATSSGVNRSLVSRLKKAGNSCPPEKIWAVIQAALGGQSVNIKAALDAAHSEARTPKRALVTKARQPEEGSRARPKAVAKQKPLAFKKISVKRERGELVDLNEFEDLADLIGAWMRKKGKVKGESSASSASKPAATAKSELRAKREPAIKRELINEIRKLGIIDLTEGEPQPRTAGRRPAVSSSSPSGKLSSSPNAKQATAGKGASPTSRPRDATQRTVAVKLLGRRKSFTKASPKRKAAEKPAEKSPRKKMPQGLKRLNKLASTCAPQKLWTILQAAAHETGTTASIGAALRAAWGTAGARRPK